MRLTYWIFSLLLLLAPGSALAQHTVLVKAQSLTLREKSSKTSKAVGKLVNLQPVEFLKQDGDWAEVKTLQSQTGYVLADYLTQSAFVYTGDEKINGRYGYGTQYDVIIEYTLPNMPLRVLDATDNGWIMVMDYEGDRSWISGKSIKVSGRYVITKQENNNFRKGIGIGQDLVFTAPKGVIFQVIEEKEGWLHVKHADGDEGWVSAKLVFGWLDVPVPGVKKSAPETGKKDSSSTTSKVKSDKPTEKSGKTSTRRKRRSSSSSDDSESSSVSKTARKTSIASSDVSSSKTTRRSSRKSSKTASSAKSTTEKQTAVKEASASETDTPKPRRARRTPAQSEE